MTSKYEQPGMENQAPPPPSYNQAGQYPQNQGYAPPPQPGVGFAYGQPGAGQNMNAPQGGYAYGQPTNAPQGYGQPVNAPEGYGQPTNAPHGYAYGSGEPKLEDTADMFDDNTFSNKTVRRGFIKKVYLILFTQLLVTFGCVMLFTLVDDIRNFVSLTQGGAIFYYVSYATFLVTYFVLICIPSVRRNHPGNLICLGVFTLAFTYMVSTISSYYTTNSVMYCAGITTAVCLAISIFAVQTKIDFTMCAGLLFALCMVLLLFGITCIIVYATVGYNRILDAVYGGLAALVFSLFLVYDTQMIVGGRKHEISPEEYVYGALQLYIDVVYLFLILLSCFGKSN